MLLDGRERRSGNELPHRDAEEEREEEMARRGEENISGLSLRERQEYAEEEKKKAQ